MLEQKYTEEEVAKIKDRILEALEMVIDPELGIDIVNLGLVYEIRFNQDGHTEIDMTLTTMGCPLADLLTDQIHDAMRDIPERSEERRVGKEARSSVSRCRVTRKKSRSGQLRGS